jgi:hypothetical protein
MRSNALILMLVMLLQPFAATAAAIDKSAMADSQSDISIVSRAAIDEHCADHASAEEAGYSAGHEHSGAEDAADCLNDCQKCTSGTGSFASDINPHHCVVPQVSFVMGSFAGLASQLFEPLYRPPISS